ncbi:MAG: efflux RND transporter permease subunit, partial [Actinomycetota bacterium]
ELLFHRGTDLLTARQLANERIAKILPTLPTWSSPPFILQPLSSTSRVLKIGLTSDTINMMDLSMTAYWKIRARLLRVPGVANVPIWGERLEMLQVQVDPNLLAEKGVKLDEAMNATADALDAGLLMYSEGHFIGTGGWIDTPEQRLGVRHVLPIVTAKDLGRVPVKTVADGAPILLEDVADLVTDHQQLAGDAVINEGPGLMLIVEKLPWANTLEVTKGVEAALEEMKPGLPGITIDASIFRPATFIESSIENLSGALLIGALLMIFMLMLFLYEWRTALISIVAIPLSLVAAAMVLHVRGTTINTMILAGFVIALGDIVDDAIIDIENVVRRLREHRRNNTGRSTARVILDASLEVRSAIVYATLIEVVAVAPIFLLGGLSGAFFRPLAISYSIALLASMIVALTVTPALSLMFFRKESSLRHRESPIVPPMVRAYHWILARIVRRPRLAYAGVAATAGVGIVLAPLLGQSLLPSFKERDFLMHWLTKPGTGATETVRIATRVNKELLTIPGVRNAGSHIGNAMLGDEPYGVDFAENWISVSEDVDYDQTLASVQEVVDGYPGVYRDVQTYLKERIREVLAGSSEAITVRIYGQDLDLLREKAEEVHEILAGTPGVIDSHVEHQTKVPQAQVEVDLDAAKRYGLKPGDVRRAAAWLMSGQEAGDIFVDGKAHDVQVWTPPELRRSLTDLENLRLDAPSGGQVLLKDVAKVTIVPQPNIIKHVNNFRKMDVGGNIDGSRDLGSIVDELEDKLAAVEWPLEFRAEMLGEFTERQEASNRLAIFAVAAAIVMFLLLQASFQRTRLAVLAFLTLPIALVGGVVAAHLGGGILSLGSLVGFLTVLGIVARNGIMLISHYQHLEDVEGMAFGPELVLRGAKERLVPIMMTVLTTGLALIPLIVAGSKPGHEIEHPMAVVILGGLIAATLINLFIVPSLYLRFGKNRKGRTAGGTQAPGATEPEPTAG